MKKTILLFAAVTLLIFSSRAQTTAMDFTMDDCSGNVHNLFAELDSGNAVIIEFFMQCTSCVNAGHKLQPMVNALQAAYPGKVSFYQMAYNNTYSCSAINSWIGSNGFTSVGFDSGASQVAYYGGFGMPTVVLLQGTNHSVAFSDIGFVTNDTTMIGNSVRSYMNGTGIISCSPECTNGNLNVFPNPTYSLLNILVQSNSHSVSTIRLTDLSGKIVAEIFSGEMLSGKNNFSLSTENIPQGIYLLSAEVNGTTSVQLVSVLK